MTFVVTEDCIKCKHTDCVDVCPVSCFHEGENMLVIDPEECIDCGICEPSCPVDAILPDSYPDAQKWVALNEEYAAKWPKITMAKSPLADADDYREVPDKFDKFFSAAPGGQG
jgi:ferredoxin